MEFGAVKTVVKDIFVSFVFGAGALGVITGILHLCGASFGPCGPGNTAAIALMFAYLPGMIVAGFLVPRGTPDWIIQATFFGSTALAYAMLAWPFRRLGSDPSSSPPNGPME